MKRINPIPTPKKISYNEQFEPFVISGVKVVGEYGKILSHAVTLLPDAARITDCGNVIIYLGEENFPDKISEKKEEIFFEKYAKKQGYHLTYDGQTVKVFAYTEIGCAYGLMTLLEMYDSGMLPKEFSVTDSPDFLYRANKWLSWCECGIWSYDRGDGIEKYKARIIEKLDLSLRYKINTIIFDAFGFGSDRFPGYNDLMRELNREARKRGIHLLSNGYGMGYGLSNHLKGSFHGSVHMNRTSYPDGEIYPCIGTYDFGWPEDYVRGREYGTCLSNDALTEEKVSEIVKYLENTEMGALYIHNMDADYILPPLWKARCERCREKWPSDDLFAEDGAAGAFAYFIKNLYEGICKAKTVEYDAKKECIVYIVSPGYMYMHASEETFDIAKRFWQSVSKLLPDYENLYIGFREHYHDHESGEMRFDKLKDGWGNANIGCANFPGGDGFYSDKLFLGSPLFYRMMQGASSMLVENGNANQEPMQLYNAEYLWNSEKSAFFNLTDIPKSYKEFQPYYIDYLKTKVRPDEIYGEGGLLEVICEKLYGKDSASDFKALYSIAGKDCEPPLTSACSCEIFTNFTKVVYPMRWDDGEMTLDSDAKFTVKKFINKFIETDKATKTAASLCQRIYDEKKYLPKKEEDVTWMKDNFLLMSRYTELLVRYMRCYEKVLSYFANGAEIPSGTKEELVDIKGCADQLLNYVTSLPLTPICPIGGATVRRDELADFISYNAEIMLRSIAEDKRIPSGLRPLRTRDHW